MRIERVIGFAVHRSAPKPLGGIGAAANFVKRNGR